MSFIESRRHPWLVLVVATTLIAGCAAPAKKATRPGGVDNLSVVRPVRQLPAAPAVAPSDTTHITTVTASVEMQTAAQQATGDYFAGVQLMKAGKLDDALVLFQQLAAQHPTLSGPLINEALVHYRKEKYAEALDAVDRALKVNDRNPFAWNLRGLLLREQGKFREARDAYQQALSIDPQYAKAHFNLGVLADLYLQEQRLALAHYERYQALQRKPDVAVGNWINDLRNRLGIVAPAAPAAPSPVNGAVPDGTVTPPANNAPAAAPSSGASPASPATPGERTSG